MKDPKDEKRGEINGMSFGKIMTSMLIPKNIRSTPKEVLKGVAFIGFICFFLFTFLSRGCQRDALMQEEPRSSHSQLIIGNRSV